MRLRLPTLCSSVKSTVTVKLSTAPGLGTVTGSVNVEDTCVVTVGDVAAASTLTSARVRASIPGIVVIVIGDDNIFPRRLGMLVRKCW